MIHSLRAKLKRADADALELLRGSAVALAIKVIAAATAFSMTVVVARQLGAKEAGIFFLAYTIVLIVAAISRLGLDNTLVRFIASAQTAHQGSQIRAIYRTSMLWSLAASLVAAIALWLLADQLALRLFGKPAWAEVMRIMTLGIPLAALFPLHASALQAIKRIPQSMTIASITTPLTMLALALALWPRQATVVAWLFVAASGLSLILARYWWSQLSQLPPGSGKVPVDRRALLASSIPLLGVTILNEIVNWSSQVMLGAWAGSADVAIFNAAQRTALLMTFVLISVNSIAAPKFAAMHYMREHERLRRTAQNATLLMVALALPPLAILLAIPAQILSLFGPDFTAGANSLRILCAAQFINVATGPSGYLLMMTGHERLLRRAVLVAAAISLLVGLALVPGTGLLGASLATAAGVATLNLICLREVKRTLGFFTLPLPTRGARPT